MLGTVYCASIIWIELELVGCAVIMDQCWFRITIWSWQSSNGKCQMPYRYTSQPCPVICGILPLCALYGAHMGIIVAYRKFITKSMGNHASSGGESSGMWRNPLNSLKQENINGCLRSGVRVKISEMLPLFSDTADVMLMFSPTHSHSLRIHSIFLRFPFCLSCVVWTYDLLRGHNMLRVNKAKFYGPVKAINGGGVAHKQKP